MSITIINKKLKDLLSETRKNEDSFEDYLTNKLKLCKSIILSISEEDFNAYLPNNITREKLADKLDKNINTLITAYCCYSEGIITTAIERMRECFLYDSEMIKIYELDESQKWYRARILDKRRKGYAPKDMFHIPFERREDVVNYRYSITGYPCLYIGNTLLSCWEEMNCPSLDDLAVSLIRLNKDKLIKVLDLRLPVDKSTDLTSLPDSEEEKKENYRQLITWPLIIACSFKVPNREVPFKLEYIHPQLLMLALKSDTTNNIMGVAYTSTHIDENINEDSSMYTNVAIPAQVVKPKGYCSTLSENFSISRGVPFMEAEVKNVFTSTFFEIEDNTLNITDGLNAISSYEKTKFGQLEKYLDSFNTALELLNNIT